MSRHCLVVLLLLLAGSSKANDITVSNVTTIVEGTASIKFDLAWKNSWRVSAAPANYDAAWVFAKYQGADGLWRPVTFDGVTNSPSGITLDGTNDNLGYFIYRSADGTGDLTITNIRLGIDGIAAPFHIKVFAIEMVYIPEGAFKVGDGDGISFSQGSLMKSDNKSFVTIDGNPLASVTSQGGSDDETLNTQGIGIDGDGGLDTNNDGTYDNALYPTGYKAFYCMKYEVSLRGIIGFLNTLTLQQQGFLEMNPTGETTPHITDVFWEVYGTNSPPTPAIFGIDTDGDGIFNETDDNETGAASSMRWKLLAAYLDWAALRPMTELEFEKICRGPVTALLNEFAWGNSVVNSSPHTLINPKSRDEAVSSALDPNGNAIYGGTGYSSSVRCGIFANATTSRKTSGAAYYGPMEMSGNAGETVVSLGNVAGRSFTGKLGDGVVTTQGFANEDHWPGINGNDDPTVPNGVATTGANGHAGMGMRGGDFTDGAALLQLSNRQHATNLDDLNTPGRGGRGVRQID